MRVTIQIPYDSGIPEKLEILRLERGISINGFIVKALAEKLKHDGFIVESDVRKSKPVRKPRDNSIPFDMAWIMRKNNR